MNADERLLRDIFQSDESRVAELLARIEQADDLLRTHFCTPSYVDTRALAVVSEALAVLAGEL